MKPFLSILISLIFFQSNYSRITSPFRENPFKLRIFHPSIPRSLLQEPLPVDKLEQFKHDKLVQMGIVNKVNISKRLENLLHSSARLLDDGGDTPLPDLKKDFSDRVTKTMTEECSACKLKDEGDNIVVADESGKDILKIKLVRRDPEPGNETKDHNVTIMMDNFDFTDEFEQKKMKGLSFIEVDPEHREEIDGFIRHSYGEIMNSEQDEEPSVSMEAISQAIDDIISKSGVSMEKVIEKADKGYLYELIADDAVKTLLAVLMIYPIDETTTGINLASHSMEEFEMQIVRELKEEDIAILTTEITNLLNKANSDKVLEISEITEQMNNWINSVRSYREVGAACQTDLAFDDSKASGSLPGMIFMKAETGDNGFTEFKQDGSAPTDETTEESEDKKPEKKERHYCMLNYASVSMINIIDMPYIFFSFSNNKMLVENFIPTNQPQEALVKLDKACQDIIAMNMMVENKIRENMDPATGETIEDFKTFQAEDLINQIKTDLSGMGLSIDEEGLNIVAKQGDEIRLMTKEITGSIKVMFFYPSDVMKKESAAGKSLTNEFVFQDNISYDALEVFNKAFEEFKEAL
jgi:hypothetical protein